jgi:hypothetical protein
MIIMTATSRFIFCITVLMVSLPFPVHAFEGGSINIYWTDLGIMQWGSWMRMADDFHWLSSEQKETVMVNNPKGQILIPMPADSEMPETDKEWAKLSSDIYIKLKSRVVSSIESGVNDIEIRTVQNINMLGYFDKQRQDKVIKFERAFTTALGSLKTELSLSHRVKVTGVWASNGGNGAAKVLTDPQNNPVDRGILIDARAKETDVKNLYHSLNGNLSIINTAGDAPAGRDLVANHDTAKMLKRELPKLNVYWVDSTFGINSWLDTKGILNHHIESTRINTSFEVKEYTGDGYKKLGSMSSSTLRERIFSSPHKGSQELEGMAELRGKEHLDTAQNIMTNIDAANALYMTSALLEKALTHLDKKDAQRIVKNATALKEFSSAIQSDIAMAGEGGFALVKSYTLEQIGRYGVKALPDIIERYRNKGSISETFKIPDMSYAGDLITAIGKDIELTGTGTNVLVQSHTIEQLGRIGLEKMPDVIKSWKDSGKLSKSFPTINISWAGDLIDAIGKDIEETSNERFVLLKSNTLEKVGQVGIENLPKTVVALKRSGILPKTFNLPGTFGAEDIAVAVGRHIGSGKADIDTITYYLDGANQAAWGVLGFMVGGNQGSRLYQSVAKKVAGIARELSQPAFNNTVVALRGQGRELVDDWRTLQKARIHNGLTVQSMRQVYGDDLLLNNGLSMKMINEFDAEAHNMNQTIIKVKQQFNINKIETYTKTGKVDVGGVCICPRPKYAGKGGHDVKKSVAESRPSPQSGVWDFDLPEDLK